MIIPAIKPTISAMPIKLRIVNTLTPLFFLMSVSSFLLVFIYLLSKSARIFASMAKLSQWALIYTVSPLTSNEAVALPFFCFYFKGFENVFKSPLKSVSFALNEDKGSLRDASAGLVWNIVSR